jgi:hypothetical protein
MPFQPKWTPRGKQDYDALKAGAEAIQSGRKSRGRSKSSKAEGLFKQVNKALRNLLNDPKHPSLNTHEYDSLVHPYDPKQKVWEAYAQNKTPGAYRVFWCYGPGKGEITIIAITPHP